MRTKDKTVHFRLKRCKTSRFRLKRREPSRLSPTLSSEEVLRAGSLSSEEVSLSALSSEAARSRAGHCITIDAACAVVLGLASRRRENEGGQRGERCTYDPAHPPRSGQMS